MINRILRPFLRRDLGREWSAKLDSLRINCAAAYPSEQEHCVLELAHLLQEAPVPLLLEGLTPLSPAQLDEWLVARNYDGAVISMLGASARYRATRDGAGQYLASVTLSGQADEHTAVGDTLALALTGAITLVLLERDCRTRPLARK